MTQTEEQKRNLDKLAEKYIIHLCGESQCTRCEYFKGYDGHKNEYKNICKAFPAGIPIDIRYRGFDHTKEYPGDNGIRFKEK